MAVVGTILRANPGSVFGTPPFTTAYAWRRDGVDITGADAQEYTTVDADAGATVTVRQTTENAFGTDSRVSVDAIAVTGALPVVDADPTIAGTPAVGETLTVTLSSTSGTPTITSTVQWLRDGVAISGATSLTYLVVSADIGTTLSARQTATSVWGTASRDSAGVVVTGVPVLLTAPVASGDPFVGETLTTTDGTWTGSPTGFTYRWLRDSVAIAGATAAAYTLVSADDGAIVEAEVTASNGAGSSTPALSNAIGPVIDVPSNLTAPVISGGITEGDVLTVTSVGTWTGSPTSYLYQWTRDGVAIAGATATTYTTVLADVGTLTRCEVAAVNAAGASAPEPSNAIGPIVSAAVAPTNDVLPVLSGAVSIGASPTVTPGTWSGTMPITYLYTLRRDGVDITGLVDVSEATIEAYEYVAADIGPDITVAEQATNSAGTATAVSNAVAYDPLADIPGLVGAYDAASGITLVGSDVDEWADQSSANNTLAPTAGNRPLYHASGFNGGSQPFIEFDNTSNDVLRRAVFSWGGADPTALTYITVQRQRTAISNVRLAGHHVSGTRIAFNQGGSVTSFVSFVTIGTPNVTTVGTSPQTTAGVYWARWDGATQSVGKSATQENSSGATARNFAGVDGGEFAISAQYNGNTPSPSNYAAMYISNVHMSNAQLADFAAYAAWRWGV